DEAIKQLLEIALKLEGLYRNSSTHAAGVVIGDKPLDQIVPIYKDPSSDMPVTQYNMKYVESTGLIKFDFLGLKTLTTLAKTMELLKLRGIEFDLGNIPLDDPETFKLLSNADTSGVFQLESAGMRKILKDMKPDKIEDIVAIVALYRPGPMGNIPSYIARKHGQEKPDYLHPLLENILKETYGIMIYQEQVMQIAQVLAGFSLGGADLLRRAMGKKKFDVMQQQKVVFIEGAKKKGVAEEKAVEIFELMEKFASYGFNKSHAAAYAFVSYQTAYLKAHYPVEFMAATMTLDKIDTDKLGFFKREIAQMGIKILPPDVNKSGVNFGVEDGAIRYAMAALKNVGDGAIEELVADREKRGPYKSIQDFIARSSPAVMNKRCLESLIKSGALDCLDKNRAKLLANVEKMGQHAASLQRSKESAQASLFGGQAAFEELRMTDVPDYPEMEKLDMEREAVGFYLSAHPLDAYADNFERLRVNFTNEIEPLVKSAGSARLRIACIINEKR
ncbi:MAG: DNA polymerase III subunit alpha, partial [Elusimicrobiaceae bacterium]|nr:DNA polymerase III subunit alpha [Elusimicrobiaceae bacterium]